MLPSQANQQLRSLNVATSHLFHILDSPPRIATCILNRIRTHKSFGWAEYMDAPILRAGATHSI